MNSKAKLDTSERGTLVPPHHQNGIKNTEMKDNTPETASFQITVRMNKSIRYRMAAGDIIDARAIASAAKEEYYNRAEPGDSITTTITILTPHRTPKLVHWSKVRK